MDFVMRSFMTLRDSKLNYQTVFPITEAAFALTSHFTSFNLGLA